MDNTLSFHPASLREFRKLAARGNVVPVYAEVNADLDTPVSAFLKIRKGRYSFLLESVEGQEKIARYSFLGTDPRVVFKSKDGAARLCGRGVSGGVRRFRAETGRGPLDELKKLMKDLRPVRVPRLPRFCGGLVGYAGYDMARFFEELPDFKRDDAGFPDCVFLLADDILIFDHFRHTIMIVSNVFLPQRGGTRGLQEMERLYQQSLRRITALNARLSRSLPAARSAKERTARPPSPSGGATRAEFCRMVEKAKKYIRDGEIIQVVLSRRMQTALCRPPFDVYRRLRSINPSPYMFFLELGEITMVGASPEILVRCEDGLVRTRPIAGTRPRGADEREDSFNEKDLLADEKERAEHVMLVDLGRNDVGRVSREGSVRVGEFMKVEKYSHVMHLVSEVTGKLKKGHDAYDVLAACFPAGTVSGSPKIRAMEIIEELERTRRGPYAGCVGYFSFSGNMDTCITIRTISIKDGTAYIQVGAGIVADSVPAKEYIETANKARALLEAITQSR